MSKRIICVGVIMAIILSLGACGKKIEGDISLDRVFVAVRDRYFHRVEAEDFTVEDFKWDNVDRISYYKQDVPRAFFLYNLSQVQIDFIKELEFVLDIRTALGGLYYVSVQAEFYDKFDAEEFTAEDFGLSPSATVEYRHAHTSYMRYLTVYLKEHGEKQVFDAIKRFKRLRFVRYAEVGGMGYICSEDE
jgi:hypothetical protein